VNRFTTLVDPVTGRTIKAGMNARPAARTSVRAVTAGYKYRAVVVNTYATDAATRTQLNPNTTRKYEVECDVVLFKSGVFYPRVPVMQRGHGVNDAEPWVPRAAKRVIGGGTVSFTRVSRRGALQELPPNLEDLDGDQVIVEFMEGDLEMPIITGSLSHAKTNRLVKEGSGWSEITQGAERGTPYQNERYLRYRGVEVRINDAGDVLIDTIGATNEEVEEAPMPTGGQVRVRVKSTERFTIQMGLVDTLEVWQDPITQEVHIDLGEGASERLVLGDKLVDWLAGHIHFDPAHTITLTGVPVTIPLDGIPQVEATKLALKETPGTKVLSSNHKVK